LKIQAYLDGELSARESREMEALLAADSQAQALLGELKSTRSALLANEPEVKLPESREFYWSQLQRRIGAAEPAEAGRVPFWMAWRRYFAPITGVAIVAVFGIFSIQNVSEDPNSILAEVENLSEHSSSMSFRSQSENMFVVWVTPNEQTSDDADWEDDFVIQ
jgi:anti-sigma factor RsiW